MSAAAAVAGSRNDRRRKDARQSTRSKPTNRGRRASEYAIDTLPHRYASDQPTSGGRMGRS